MRDYKEVEEMTNYEKMMQEMTPEKMAEVVMCPYDGGELPCVPERRNCIECRAEWLAKEAEEDA